MAVPDVSYLPKVNWPEDAPNGLWVCGCGEVHIHYKKVAMPHGECFCVNCQVQCKVAVSKQKGDHNYCFSPDTGARWMTQCFFPDVNIVKGADNLAYYRCAVNAMGESTKPGTTFPPDAPGDEYKETHEHHNIITECCGTYVGIVHAGHKWLIDIDNPWRMKGWKPKPMAQRLYFSVHVAPVIGLSYDGHGTTLGPATGDPCTCACCCGVCKMCCCCPNPITGPGINCCRICGHHCCPCCCAMNPDPKFAVAPIGAKEHNGKTMEYITNPIFLKPKAEPPRQLKMTD